MNRLENTCHRCKIDAVFADTDASGRVHFSKILTYVERAEHQLLSSLDIAVHDSGKIGWPRVRVNCDFIAGIKFEDEVEVLLELSKLGTSSLSWKFEIVGRSDALAASGEMITVKVAADGRATAISDRERSKLERLL
ncbi:MAG: acyl-CoA thioesterase [Akkermansiaceae bacterium]